jgi:hypothetical protein
MSILIPLIEPYSHFNIMFSLLEFPGIFAICFMHTVKEKKKTIQGHVLNTFGSIIFRIPIICHPTHQCSDNVQEEGIGRVQEPEVGGIAGKQDVTRLLHS